MLIAACHDGSTSPSRPSPLGSFSLQYVGTLTMPIRTDPVRHSYMWADTLTIRAGGASELVVLRDSIGTVAETSQFVETYAVTILTDTVIKRSFSTETLLVSTDGLRARRKDPEHSCSTNGVCEAYWRRVQ
ncbi:MAG: hypothetical protein U0163_10135 [Gemmatimonadaceae bacterium]